MESVYNAGFDLDELLKMIEQILEKEF